MGIDAHIEARTGRVATLSDPPDSQSGRSPFERFSRDRLERSGEELTRADWGFFGPGSVSWRIHSHPIVVVGGFRALIIQSLHPLAIAGISQFSDYKVDPLKRFRRTAQYIHQVTFSDKSSALAAADRVRKIHSRVRGVDPVTGREFSASDPETLLWVHCAEQHSFLAAYRQFVEPISADDQDQFLAEQVAAGELIGIPRDMIPDSRDSYRKYFARMLPSLCLSQAAAETIRFVTRPDLRLVPITEWPFALNLKFAAHAAVTLVPRSLRPIAGLPMPGTREYMLSRWTRVNGRAMNRALKMEQVASRFDSMAQRTLGTEPTPVAARRGIS